MHSVSDQLIQLVILKDIITPQPPPKSNVYKTTLTTLIAIS